MDKRAKFKKYKSRAAELLKDNERVNTLLSKTSNKLKSIIDSNEKLKDFSEKVYTLFRMLKAQFNGDYTAFPWQTLVLIAGAMLYFVTPFDLIPDFIPALGLTDDMAIVLWVYNSLQEDIALFELWENTLNIEPIDEK